MAKSLDQRSIKSALEKKVLLIFTNHHDQKRRYGPRLQFCHCWYAVSSGTSQGARSLESQCDKSGQQCLVTSIKVCSSFNNRLADEDFLSDWALNILNKSSLLYLVFSHGCIISFRGPTKLDKLSAPTKAGFRPPGMATTLHVVAISQPIGRDSNGGRGLGWTSFGGARVAAHRPLQRALLLKVLTWPVHSVRCIHFRRQIHEAIVVIIAWYHYYFLQIINV